jgi:CheY-like chemotaxis protein
VLCSWDAVKPILIAEDCQPDAELIAQTLKLAGVCNPLMFVADGVTAIAYLMGDGIYANRDAFPLPGVLLLDLKMPRLGGIEVLEWCRTQPQLREILVIVLSGFSELRDVNRAYALGAQTFLTKPATEADILNIIKAHAVPWSVSPPS